MNKGACNCLTTPPCIWSLSRVLDLMVLACLPLRQHMVRSYFASAAESVEYLGTSRRVSCSAWLSSSFVFAPSISESRRSSVANLEWQAHMLGARPAATGVVAPRFWFAGVTCDEHPGCCVIADGAFAMRLPHLNKRVRSVSERSHDVPADRSDDPGIQPEKTPRPICHHQDHHWTALPHEDLEIIRCAFVVCCWKGKFNSSFDYCEHVRWAGLEEYTM